MIAGTSAYVSGITSRALEIPRHVVLEPAVPNPFRAATGIRFGLPNEGSVTLEVYSVAGERVATLLRGPVSAGYHTVLWDGSSSLGRLAASGVYYCRLKTGQGSLTTRLVVLR